jgi:hypothetical protein
VRQPLADLPVARHGELRTSDAPDIVARSVSNELERNPRRPGRVADCAKQISSLRQWLSIQYDTSSLVV